MNVPRTSSGKPCKLCIAKGGPCHLHASDKKSASPKKSPPISQAKSKSPTNWFDQYKGLPQAALYEVLLGVNREQLHYICTTSRQAAKICAQTRFRKEYDARHTEPGLMIGKIKQNYPDWGTSVVDKLKRKYFEDEDGSTLIVGYDNNNVVMKVVYSRIVERSSRGDDFYEAPKRMEITIGALVGNQRAPAIIDMYTKSYTKTPPPDMYRSTAAERRAYIDRNLDRILEIIGKRHWKKHLTKTSCREIENDIEEHFTATKGLTNVLWKIFRGYMIKVDPTIKELKWKR